mgnify:CR=1 FL=1
MVSLKIPLEKGYGEGRWAFGVTVVRCREVRKEKSQSYSIQTQSNYKLSESDEKHKLIVIIA